MGEELKINIYAELRHGAPVRRVNTAATSSVPRQPCNTFEKHVWPEGRDVHYGVVCRIVVLNAVRESGGALNVPK